VYAILFQAIVGRFIVPIGTLPVFKFYFSRYAT